MSSGMYPAAHVKSSAPQKGLVRSSCFGGICTVPEVDR